MTEPHQTIWKYPFRIIDKVALLMPQGAKLLYAAPCNEPGKGDLCVWALVQPQAKRLERRLHVFGTGQEIPTTQQLGNYLGTVELGVFVWHLFDAGEFP